MATSAAAQPDLQPNMAANAEAVDKKQETISLVSLGNSTGKEQKHREASPRTPSVVVRKTRQGIVFPPSLRTLVVVQMISWLASN